MRCIKNQGAHFEDYRTRKAEGDSYYDLMSQLQATMLHPHFDNLQLQYGDSELCSIYGAGCTERPKYVFVFMNPTARNPSAQTSRGGLRAPWIGLKQTWKLYYDLGLLDKESFLYTQNPGSWSPEFVQKLYEQLAGNGLYVTNLAKCTQLDARPLGDKVFKSYKELFLQEMDVIKPQHIITFGNQVSSIVLDKKILVSDYPDYTKENLSISGNIYEVYPCRYPVGMGYRNIHKAIARLRGIIKS